MDAPCFLYTNDTVYEKYFDDPIGILLFLCSIIFVLKGRRSGAPCFLYAVLHVKKACFLLNKGPPIGNPLLFVRGATRVKSLFFAESGAADREPLAFCTRCYACKKSIFC
jgi:hypothetical protein